MTKRLRRLLNALLAGGVVVFGLGCKTNPIRIFWPKDQPHTPAAEESSAASTEADAVVSNPSPNPTQPVLDEGSFGYQEAGTGAEDAPGGRPTPEVPPILFDLDDAELSTAAIQHIDAAAAYLNANAALGVVLRGHTDTSGTEEYNLALGGRRAQSVRDALIRKGITPDRLDTVSFGELMPLQEEQTDADRTKDRRVEFFFYEREKN